MNHITLIGIELLLPHPNNPRKQLGDLTELAESIKANGVYQNLTVVANGDGFYTIIIGHRRHAAAKLAGIDKLPCVITQMTEKQQLETMLIENMQRSDLTVIEEAQGLQLMIDLGDSVTDISKATGFSKNKIKSRLFLNNYDVDTVEKAFKKGATLEDYVKLSRIKDDKKREEVAKHLGTSNFDYYANIAIEHEKWIKEKQKIIGVLESFNAIDSTQNFINYSDYLKSCTMVTAKEVYDFCEDNHGREIRFKMPNYSDSVVVYVMKTKEEIQSSNSNNKGNDETARRAAIADYRINLINRLESYIDNYIAEHDDHAMGLNNSSQLVAIECIIRSIIVASIENDHGYYQQQTALSALNHLGLSRDKIARKDTNEFYDVSYVICADESEGKKALHLGKNPVQFLLALLRTYVNLSSCSEYDSYDGSYKCVKFRKTKHLALLIETLERHGFQTPDELTQYIEGTHPIYTEEGCKKIIDEQFEREEKQ